MLNIYDYLDELQNDIFTLPPYDIERKYYQICEKLAGTRYAQEINKINMKNYEKELEDKLNKSIEYLDNYTIRSIYFEYDLDNEWVGQYYLCEEYYNLEDADDDWACEWEVCVEGPGLVEFGQIYSAKGGFDDTNVSIGVTIYLITRTVVSFLNSIKNYELKIPICIGYHDQDPIMRMKKD
ncbi:hypothetical protein AAHH71_30170 [Bacillus toyonensis]